MSCTSGCPKPGSHATWGECLRAKALQIQPGIMDAPTRKEFDAENRLYAAAKADGIQPKAVTRKAVEAARKFTDVTGVGDPW